MTSALPSYEQATALVADYATQLGRLRRPAERVELALAAGRVLAKPLTADRDQPPFARSTRDGFACRAAEACRHKKLPVAGSSHAGEAPAGPLPPGSAWEIMTGAPVPEGADAVMMLEHVETAGGRVRLRLPRTVEPGENIVAQGAQARTGDLLLPAGTVIASGQIALAAACGHSSLEVFARPRVAILATGDELVPVESEPAAGQIRNSNAPMLAAMVAAAGGDPWVLPTAADTAEALDAALAQAAEADLLLISGGVSAGKFDLVEPALARMGAHFHFTGVRIQPGKPLVFGEMPRTRARRSAHAAPLRAAGKSGFFGCHVSAVCDASAGGAGRTQRRRAAVCAGTAGSDCGPARQGGPDALSAGTLRFWSGRSRGWVCALAWIGRSGSAGPRQLLPGCAGRGPCS
jgi:molybdopterin molybdotransferase